MLHYLGRLAAGALATEGGLREAKAGWALQRAAEKRAWLALQEAAAREQAQLLREMATALAHQTALTKQQEEALDEAEDEALATLREAGQAVPAGLVRNGGGEYYLPLKLNGACAWFEADEMPQPAVIEEILKAQLQEGPYELPKIVASYTGIACRLSRRCG